MESCGYSVSVFSHSANKTKEFIKKEAQGKSVIGTYSISEFVDSLIKPRNILIMMKTGRPTNSTINELKPYLQKGDIIIDGGNTVKNILSL
jgi:6-phosphogluconate dehydrogenase